MPPKPTRQHLPSGIVLLGIALAGYYLLVFRPLAQRVEALDHPLIGEWEKFLATNQASAACAGLNLENFTERLRQLQSSATNLETAQRLVRGRVALEAATRARMEEPFQLIDFQNERHQRAEQVVRLAKEKGVALEPGATNGLPEYVADMPEPSLMWARLQMATQVLLTAAHCKVGTLRALTQLPSVSHRSRRDGTVFLSELPMRLELIGPMESVSRFLVSLPLQASELKVVGLAEVLTNKPVLFLDRILLRKYAPDKPSDVLLELTLSGFVPWMEPRGTILRD